MASPRAISSRIDASEAPWNTVSTVRTSRPQRSIWRMASRAASRSAGEAPVSAASFCSAGTASDECSAAERLGGQHADGGIAVGQPDERQRLLQRVAHGGTVSFAIAASTTGAAPAAAWWPSFMAAPRRASGSGLASWHARLVGVEERLDGDAQPAIGARSRPAPASGTVPSGLRS